MVDRISLRKLNLIDELNKLISSNITVELPKLFIDLQAEELANLIFENFFNPPIEWSGVLDPDLANIVSDFLDNLFSKYLSSFFSIFWMVFSAGSK